MNQRETKESNLPKLRTWDGKSLAWLPEKTDHPLQGNVSPTKMLGIFFFHFFHDFCQDILILNNFSFNPFLF